MGLADAPLSRALPSGPTTGTGGKGIGSGRLEKSDIEQLQHEQVRLLKWLALEVTTTEA